MFIILDEKVPNYSSQLSLSQYKAKAMSKKFIKKIRPQSAREAQS